MKEIYLAGGCFWGVEAYFTQIEGVLQTRVGYANGQSDVTSYDLIAHTDHAETVYIQYNPEIISLREILLYYFRVIDPFAVNHQGNDYGRQYRTGIYYVDEADRAIAEQVMEQISRKFEGRALAVELEPLQHFIDAEDYHQAYLKKNPNGYCHIDQSLAKVPLTDS
ncbi:peptide-methionine (S)-S-oxide reductase [Streptococcus chenjunshii]|uniref:Peptide methionine sulfoxide reductase MsrA n=1 Tax=Streptococcus chenjunshii TaxID=2173853 RepID=A0A372KP29_9STRE|nr:peptide-methionine (S)-S-oxide reductase MsrA [Streptococcus chenjunshii]AXQ79102.1 peptide-methionine (S)-S-oxide reductase [Streptococcus chenjunshii]RFU50297.1 peptide-methionine (S)-S-oxide reductase [Streptococcus chenjunshii]RFU53328.1 peptide-methionine (S)-S-oxide reductase [Streptococcus chenjunshii]